MGLFDWVYAPFKCPYCGYEEEEHGWQTKALLNMLNVFKVGEKVVLSSLKGELVVQEGVFEIHTVCPKCKEYVECRIKIKGSVLTDEITCNKEDKED